MWASVFRVASCPELMLIVIAVNYGVSSILQLLLDNCAHLLKHNTQRNLRLRILLDRCYVDQHKVGLFPLEASAAMVAFVSVAVVVPALVVQHLEPMLPQKGYISVVVTGVHHPACAVLRAESW